MQRQRASGVLTCDGGWRAGVRSTARLVSMTETGVKQAATVAGQQIKPALAATEKKARGAGAR